VFTLLPTPSLPECNLTCPDGYTRFDDCSGCELTDLCLADNPCLNGGTCYLVRPPSDFRCDCPEAAEGERCEAAFAFINNTPRVTLSDDGRTYNITVEFSPGNGGSFYCTMRRLSSGAMVNRQSCNSLRYELMGIQTGVYVVKVIRLSENVREVISDRVNAPPRTTK